MFVRFVLLVVLLWRYDLGLLVVVFELLSFDLRWLYISGWFLVVCLLWLVVLFACWICYLVIMLCVLVWCFRFVGCVGLGLIVVVGGLGLCFVVSVLMVWVCVVALWLRVLLVGVLIHYLFWLFVFAGLLLVVGG